MVKTTKRYVKRKHWMVSATTPGEKYEVERHRDGVATCSCKGYRYRQDCKHVQAAKKWK